MIVYDEDAECVEEGIWEVIWDYIVLLFISHNTLKLSKDIIINDELNISYDVIKGASVHLQPLGIVSIQFKTVDNTTMRNGRFELTSDFIFDGQIKFLMENLTYTGNFTVNLITSDNEINPENPVQFIINDEFRFCRTVKLHETTNTNYEALKLEVIETNNCEFEWANADWVLYTYIAICALAVLTIIFSLVTCFVRPLKKKTWYPSV